jgi:hypothetical protein
MTSTESPPNKSVASRLFKPIGWLLTAIGFLVRFLLLAWATLAIYWSNLPWAGLRLVLALVFLAFGIYALWLKRKPRTLLVFVGLFAVVVVWYISFSLPTIVPGGRRWR